VLQIFFIDKLVSSTSQNILKRIYRTPFYSVSVKTRIFSWENFVRHGGQWKSEVESRNLPGVTSLARFFVEPSSETCRKLAFLWILKIKTNKNYNSGSLSIIQNVRSVLYRKKWVFEAKKLKIFMTYFSASIRTEFVQFGESFQEAIWRLVAVVVVFREFYKN